MSHSSKFTIQHVFGALLPPGGSLPAGSPHPPGHLADPWYMACLWHQSPAGGRGVGPGHIKPQGLLEAVTFPSMNPMTTRWAPEQERNRFMSYAYMGGTVSRRSRRSRRGSIRRSRSMRSSVKIVRSTSLSPRPAQC